MQWRATILVGLLAAAVLAAPVSADAPTWLTGAKVAPPGPYNAQMTPAAVSCTSAGSCAAVGSFSDGEGRTEGLLQSEAGGSWSAGTQAALPGGTAADPRVDLTAVSCASAGNCTAVGTYRDASSHTQGLLLTETGGSWATGAEAALPAGAAASPMVSMNAVSCTSPGNCTAVGTYVDGSFDAQGLLLTESSGTWATGVKAPLPAGAHASASGVDITGVSCSSAGNCAAVGAYTDTSTYYQGVLLTQSSGSWSPLKAPLPGNANINPGVSLTAVSCSSAGNCAAVGGYLDSTVNNQGMMLTESGGTWSAGVETSVPGDASGTPGTYLGSVSCSSDGNCAAAGSYQDSSFATQGLLVSESGDSWNAGVKATLPGDAGASPGVTLTGVSCGADGDCGAVGEYADSAGDRLGLVVGESGGSWSPGTETTLPAGAAGGGQQVSLTGVSCPASGACTAVGSYYDSAFDTQALAISRSGGAWGSATESSEPSGAGSAQDAALTSIACTAAGSCTAAGTYNDAVSHHHGLLATLAGGSWSSAEAVLPAGAGADPSVSINSISCASTGNCAAAGTYLDGSGYRQGLLISESGGTWGTGVEAALPAGAGTNPAAQLSSVSCASAGNCTAVGYYTDGSNHHQGVLLNETAGTWGTGVEAALPAGAGASPAVSLNAVSCASAGNCAAAGYYFDGAGHQQGLLLNETAGTWGAGAEAGLPGDAGSSPAVTLSAVSCSSAGNCAAAGVYSDGSAHHQGLLLNETAGTWSTGATAPLPAGANSNPAVNLGSISCPADGNCTAAGYYADGVNHRQGLLVNETAGTWDTPGQEVTAPGGSGVSLNSVSCAAPGTCSAVGSYVVGSDSEGVMVSESGGTPAAATELATPGDAAGNPNVLLQSVSCDSATDCTAVGSYENVTSITLPLGLTVEPVPALAAGAPASATAAGAIAPASITAALSGGSAPTGTVTFVVFGPQASAPTSCASGGTTVGTASVSDNGTYMPASGFTPPSAGDYWWYASYGGDGSNLPSASACGTGMPETAVNAAVGGGGGGGSGGGGGGTPVPTLSLSAPASSPAGSAIAPSATITGAGAGSTITFVVFGPQAAAPTDCSSGGTAAGSVAVSGDGVYAPPSAFMPVSTGTYWWYATDGASAAACGPGMAETIVTAPSLFSGPPIAAVTQQLSASLHALAMYEARPRIHVVLANDGVVSAFTAPTAGTLTSTWYGPGGLVASGRRVYATAGASHHLPLALTAMGRRLLGTQRNVTLQEFVTFRPPGDEPIRVAMQIVLHR